MSLSQKDHRLYQHSGKLGYSPLIVVFLGIPIIILLSILYSYLVVYIAFFGVAFVLLFAYVFSMTFAVAKLASTAKCRSELALGIYGFTGGLIGLYFAWVFFIYALFGKYELKEPVSMFNLILSPSFLWDLILFVNQNGWYSIKGATPSGFVLWILWGIEAAVIVIAPTLLATMSIADRMFCENCGVWCDTKISKFRVSPTALQSLSVDEIDPTTLSIQPEMPEKSVPCIQEELLKCPLCGKTQGLRYTRINPWMNRNGEIEESAVTIKGIVLAHNR